MMSKYILDDLEKYAVFSRKLEDRVRHVSDHANVDVKLLEQSIFNAYQHWIREYDKAVLENRHLKEGIHLLQMKLELLFRSLLSRNLAKVINKKSIHSVGTNVVKLFDPLSSSGYVDYRGRIEFQNMFSQHINSYIAVDFCATIFRELSEGIHESPFGKEEVNFQTSVTLATQGIGASSHNSIFKLLRLRHLPVKVPVPHRKA